ncbi:hypothetical protein JDV09_26215, partial [Mycobacterium sp. Y57]|uniref:hypothetical protein n=1 Tax=Mycolicibacterium xanthum TaxID=2796469 RepID=UPI001C85CEC9
IAVAPFGLPQVHPYTDSTYQLVKSSDTPELVCLQEFTVSATTEASYQHNRSALPRKCAYELRKSGQVLTRIPQKKSYSTTVASAGNVMLRGCELIRRYLAAALSITAVMAVLHGESAPAASAAPDPWIMPDVENMVLQRAIDTVRDVIGDDVELKIGTSDTKGTREQYNYAYWTVCWQWPAAGDEISQQDASVGFGVKRLSDDNCWA